MKVIEVEKLDFGYEKDFVLKNINFSIETGDFVAIIGSNGAGKSTLLKLLLNEHTPSSGTIKWFDNDIKEFKQWGEIGYLPQNNILANNAFPATVEEVVKANLYSKIGFMKFTNSKHKAQTLEALKLVNMQEYSSRLIGSLSGGQQQKVLLARALVNSPKVLILDEPTTGVDYKSSAELYKLLAKFNKENNLTIIMVTHSIESVYEYLNKAFYIEKNSLVELSTKTIALYESEVIACNHLPHIKVCDL